MTEEQIEQKAEEYSEAFIEKGVAKASYAKGYIAGATENTELLSKRILELQQTNGALTDKVNELEKENKSLESIKNICVGDLLKAKEIIKEFISLLHKPRTALGVDDLEAKAEAFLKE